ncbi:MAG: hypothetical protein ABI894_04980 [Ilumatobacteraceae bacterium]
MGHVQRVFEAAGIPTVGIYIAAFAHVPARMGVSRALITDHPMGRPLGAPGDAFRQRDVVRAALELLTGTARQAIVSFPHPYRTAPNTR